MLAQLLSLLEQARASSIQELAAQLGLRESAVSARIEYLEHIGVLRRLEYSGSCRGNCSGCKANCPAQPLPTTAMPLMWEIVAKPIQDS